MGICLPVTLKPNQGHQKLIYMATNGDDLSYALRFTSIEALGFPLLSSVA